jgi:OOP family OmpA-OmpF porin
MHRTLNLWSLALLMLLPYPPAWAREAEAPALEALPSFDVERLALNPGTGSLLVGGDELLQPDTFRVAMGTHYQHTPLRMNTSEQRLSLINHRVTTVVTGALGILPWLEVDLQVPLIIAQSGDSLASQGLQSPARRGLGTPTAHARLAVLSRRAGHAFNLSVDLGLGLPLGSSLALAREPLPRFQAHALMGRRLGPVRATLNGGVLLRVPKTLGPEALTRSRMGQELHLGAALSSTGERLKAEAAVRSAIALETGKLSTEVFTGLRSPLHSWRNVSGLNELGIEVFAIGGMGVGSLPGTPGFRMLVGVAGGHTPPPEGARPPIGIRASEELFNNLDNGQGAVPPEDSSPSNNAP